MSERKVINKYYPPDFDPSKIVKKKKKVKTGSASLPTVRLMTPFSMKCLNCGEYISKSRKFNARKETTSETYLGMKIIRFHIKCPRCASEILFRTDPKSADYVIEHGAQKNYDSGNTNKVLREETLDETLSRLEKEEQEAKELEMKKDRNQTTLEELESKLNNIRRQQEISDELEEIRERNERYNESLVNSDVHKEVTKKLREEEAELLKKWEKEDELLANAAFSEAPNLAIKKAVDNRYTSSNSESDSDGYDQPLSNILSNPTKVVVKRKANPLGVSIKKTKR